MISCSLPNAYVVPYDFDFAALVSPPYLRVSGADSRLAIHHKATLDSSINKLLLQECLDKFKRLQKTGFTCFKQCDKLKGQEKAEMTAYIRSFFKKTKKQDQFIALFLGED